MTIYAITDSLIADSGAAGISGPIWTLISQSAILQGGNPYFVPDFASRFEARLALAVKIGKLGKGIAPRFAYRYAGSVAPAVVFVAADRLNMLRENGLPWTSALSYDRSLAIGTFLPMEYERISQCVCSLAIESASGCEEFSLQPSASGSSLEEVIEAISRDNTLKTGDILLIGLAAEGPEAKPDCRARLSINGVDSLSFNIR